MAKKALQILLQSVLDIWDNLLTLTLANMFWSVSILPMLAALSFVPGFPGFVLAGILGALIGAPVAIALVATTVDVSRLERVEFGEITRNLKYYYKRAWVVGALNAVFLILANFQPHFLLDRTGHRSGNPVDYNGRDFLCPLYLVHHADVYVAARRADGKADGQRAVA